MRYTQLEIGHYPLIKDVAEEKEKALNMIKEVYEKFNSIKNKENRKEALDKLDGYAYVENDYKLRDGRYARYIDTSDPLDMFPKMGGFVVTDNGYTITLRNNNRTFKVNKRNKLFFMIMMTEDVMRSRIHRMRN